MSNGGEKASRVGGSIFGMSYLGKGMEQNDYYNTSVPKEVLEAKNNAISARWKELSEFYLKYSDEMIK